MEVSFISENFLYKGGPSTLVLGASPVSPVSQNNQLKRTLMLKRRISVWPVLSCPSPVCIFLLEYLR